MLRAFLLFPLDAIEEACIVSEPLNGRFCPGWSKGTLKGDPQGDSDGRWVCLSFSGTCSGARSGCQIDSDCLGIGFSPLSFWPIFQTVKLKMY